MDRGTTSRSASPRSRAKSSPPRNAALSDKLFPRSKQHQGFSQEGFMPKRRRMQTDLGIELGGAVPLGDSPLAASIARTQQALLSSDDEASASTRDLSRHRALASDRRTRIPRSLAMEAAVLSPAVSHATRGRHVAEQRLANELAASVLHKTPNGDEAPFRGDQATFADSLRSARSLDRTPADRASPESSTPSGRKPTPEVQAIRRAILG